MKTTTRASLQIKLEQAAHLFIRSIGRDPGELEAVLQTPDGFNMVVTTSSAVDALKSWFEPTGASVGRVIDVVEYPADEDESYPSWCVRVATQL